LLTRSEPTRIARRARCLDASNARPRAGIISSRVIPRASARRRVRVGASARNDFWISFPRDSAVRDAGVHALDRHADAATRATGMSARKPPETSEDPLPAWLRASRVERERGKRRAAVVIDQTGDARASTDTRRVRRATAIVPPSDVARRRVVPPHASTHHRRGVATSTSSVANRRAPVQTTSRSTFGKRRADEYDADDLMKAILRSSRDDLARASSDLSPWVKPVDDGRDAAPRVRFASVKEYRDFFAPSLAAELRADAARASDSQSSSVFTVVDGRAGVDKDDFFRVEMRPRSDVDGNAEYKVDDLVLMESADSKRYALGWVESAPRLSAAYGKARTKPFVVRAFFGTEHREMRERLSSRGARFRVARVVELSTTLREMRALTSVRPDVFSRIKGNNSAAVALQGDAARNDATGMAPGAYDVVSSSLNACQLKAVVAATSRAFTNAPRADPVLIQGPPGTGKTHVIVSLIAALLNGVDATGKPRRARIMCASQSNAAVDQIVERVVEGWKSIDPKLKSLFRGVDVVRIGAEDKIVPGSAAAKCHVNRRLRDAGVNPDDYDDDDDGDEEDAKTTAFYERELESIRRQRQKLEADIREEQKRAASRSKSFGGVIVPACGPQLDAMRARHKALFRRQDETESKLKAKRAEEGRTEYKAIVNTPFERIVDGAHVVTGTLSAMGQLAKKTRGVTTTRCAVSLFDAVIIDEASQAVETATLIPMQWLKPGGLIVLVGDPKQLAPTILSKPAKRARFDQSMFERLQNAGVAVHALSEQYRMHPKIVRFPSDKFYGGALYSGPGSLEADRSAPYHSRRNCGPFQFFNARDARMVVDRARTGSKSCSNSLEAHFAARCYEIIAIEAQKSRARTTVGVITPYADQVRHVREYVKRLESLDAASEWAPVTFGTVDQIQGREFDAVIVSCVRAPVKDGTADFGSGDLGFLRDERRVNVALTRGRRSVWVVGRADTLATDACWKDLIEHSKQQGSFVGNIGQSPYAEAFG